MSTHFDRIENDEVSDRRIKRRRNSGLQVTPYSNYRTNENQLDGKATRNH